MSISFEKDEEWAYDGSRVDEPLPIEEKLDKALLNDDKEEFLSLIQQEESLFQSKGQQILVTACQDSAFECASALIKGETPVVVDVNGRTPDKTFVIHDAAIFCNPSIIEFLIYHGARTDARADVDCLCWEPRHGPKLPLDLPLYEMSRDDSIKEWTPADSIFKLVTSICLPRFQDHLETIGLLAWNTKNKEIEEEILQYARDGQIAHIAALLLVVHKKLSDSMETVLNSLFSLNGNAMNLQNQKDAILLLFELFVQAGSAIEAYVKQEKFGVTIQQTSKDVACLLQEAGFALQHADTDLTRCTWFRRGNYVEGEWRVAPAKDTGMLHYGKSGHRWKTYVSLTKPRRKSIKEIIGLKYFSKSRSKPVIIEERLDRALINDDKEEFLSTIRQDKSLYQLKGQEILEKACEYRALECAAVLLKGETGVVVGINGRTSDKMFPIHHAAKTCHPSISELLLHFGARADARADVHCVCHPPLILGAQKPCFRKRLPLYLTLYELSHDDAIGSWKSIFQLLTSICLPRFQNHLETVELLSRNTKDKEIEQEFLQCARDGELKHMAALLVAAHKKLSDPIEQLLKSLDFVYCGKNVCEENKEAMVLLLKVFSRAGDVIEAYVKQGKIGVTVHQTCKEVASLLQGAGFTLKHEDTDLTSNFWFQRGGYNKREWRWKPEDSGMPHYGKSGCRWIAYGTPRQPFLVFGKKVADERSIGEKHFHSQVRVDAKAKDEVKRAAVPCSSSLYRSAVVAEVVGDLTGEAECLGATWNVLPSNLWTLLASAKRRFMKHNLIK